MEAGQRLTPLPLKKTVGSYCLSPIGKNSGGKFSEKEKESFIQSLHSLK